MPALGAFLADSELRDLVAFLASSRKAQHSKPPPAEPFEVPPFLPFLVFGLVVLVFTLRVAKTSR